MEFIQKAIGFFEANPIYALALGLALLLIFLYKHPKIFLVLAVVAAVLYLVFSLAEVGTSKKGRLIEKSDLPENMARPYYFY